MRSKKLVEKILQKQRFKKILPFVKGKSVLDFGGNKGELKEYISQKYTLCNEDYSVLKGKKFDTIVSLAVVEHIQLEQVLKIIKMLREHLNKNGRIIITTPTKRNKPVLEFLAKINLLDRENIKEHKHYWSKEELFNLAKKVDLDISHYKKFQFGLNQIIVLDS